MGRERPALLGIPPSHSDPVANGVGVVGKERPPLRPYRDGNDASQYDPLPGGDLPRCCPRCGHSPLPSVPAGPGPGPQPRRCPPKLPSPMPAGPATAPCQPWRWPRAVRPLRSASGTFGSRSLRHGSQGLRRSSITAAVAAAADLPRSEPRPNPPPFRWARGWGSTLRSLLSRD